MKLFLFFICFILFKSLALEIGEKGFLNYFKKYRNKILFFNFFIIIKNKAPAFNIMTTDDQQISLEGFKGQTLILFLMVNLF